MLRSIFSIVLGYITATLLGYAGQQMFSLLLPAQTVPGTALVPFAALLVLLFEALCNVGGGLVTGMLAPRRPAMHAAVLGAIMTLLVLASSASLLEDSPGWYAVAVVLVTLPATALGGRLAERFRPVAAETPQGTRTLI